MTAHPSNARARPCETSPLNLRGKLLRTLAALLRIYRERQGLHRLRALDDHMLRDIGLHRGDIERVMRLPLACDANAELRRLSLRSRHGR